MPAKKEALELDDGRDKEEREKEEKSASEKKPKADRKEKKKYKKDENRNIMPNTVNQMFSFLEKKFKSESKLKEVIAIHGFGKVCSAKSYYVYQRVLKSKLTNYLTEQKIDPLFELVDPSLQLFTLQQQLTFIKINCILLFYYLRSP